MSRANLLKTETKSFLDLVGNGKIYHVPPFQRDYSWSDEQWEDLWADVVALRESPEARHYMGAIVVEGKTDREFLIIDGQQRVATLSVLALAVIARLGELASQGVDTEDNLERAKSLRARFIGEKDPVSLNESSKLFLNGTDDGFYQDNLIQLRPPLNIRALPKSNQLLWRCFNYFKNVIGNDAQIRDSGLSLAGLLSETVARQLLFILITVEDDMNAYTVFETLNSRGLELSATDLLKNYLFSLIKSDADLKALGRRWKNLVLTVQQERFPEFLRYDLLCKVPKIRHQRLFKIVREQVPAASGVFDLMARLERRGEIFSATDDPSHSYWLEMPDAQPLIEELKLFQVRQQMPAIFAAHEAWAPDEFVKLLRILVAFSFRYTVIGSLNPNELEPRYHEVAKGILSERFSSARDAFEPLRHLYPTDDTFRRAFEERSFRTSGARKKLVKYILCRLETEMSGSACDWRTDPATIEHILPENPSPGWDETIPAKHQEDLVFRLGNLTLLERRMNRNSGNEGYSVKRSSYEKSAYALTRAIAEQARNEWTVLTLNERQKKLATRATAIWKVAP